MSIVPELRSLVAITLATVMFLLWILHEISDIINVMSIFL